MLSLFRNVRKQVKGTGVNVTISDMKYSYTKKGADATFIFKNEDMVHARTFFYLYCAPHATLNITVATSVCRRAPLL
jgi:hypothetical protein